MSTAKRPDLFDQLQQATASLAEKLQAEYEATLAKRKADVNFQAHVTTWSQQWTERVGPLTVQELNKAQGYLMDPDVAATSGQVAISRDALSQAELGVRLALAERDNVLIRIQYEIARLRSRIATADADPFENTAP